MQAITGVEQAPPAPLTGLRNILVVRPHNQLGDMLACVSLFRMLKENFPESRLTLIASPANATGVVKNRFIDRLVVFDKRKAATPGGFFRFLSILREGYDAVIVPAVVSVSYTSNLIARLAKTDLRIGPASLDGVPNASAHFFNTTVAIDWRGTPGRSVYEHSCAILAPYKLRVSSYSSEVSYDHKDGATAISFLKENGYQAGQPLVCMHAGAGKPPNRWPAVRFGEVAAALRRETGAFICFTGSESDLPQINEAVQAASLPKTVYLGRSIPEVAALASSASLFLTNDTGIMHVAGAVQVPQISLFGPTNPQQWAPPGHQKHYLKNSDDISSITTAEVLRLSLNLLQRKSP